MLQQSLALARRLSIFWLKKPAEWILLSKKINNTP